MLKQMQDMQAKMARAQEELESEVVTGSSGGGVVTASANGHQRLTSVTITAEALEEGAEILSDLVLAACNDALEQSRNRASEAMAKATAGLSLPPGIL